ncbi:MAG: serine/threonine-protein kinase, partial [Planctomycetota bacterium]
MADGPLGIGERLGRYEIEAVLGRGGMGVVYRAFDPAANRHVALKVLPAGAPEEDRLRFQREVEVLGNIQHPHIMPVFDSGHIGSARFVTMELLKGPIRLGDLAALARSGEAVRDPHLRPVSTLEGLIRRIILPICEAVYHANARHGVLHRDLKPANVLVDRHGIRPFVIDFGVCSVMEKKNARLSHLPPEAAVHLPGGGVRVTGTLVYMPPEQARGEVDRRGDVWALGAILHHMVTGAPPLAPASRAVVPTPARIEGLRLLIEQARRDGNHAEIEEFTRKLREVQTGGERSIEALQRDVLSGSYLPRPAWVPRPLEAVIQKAMSPEPDRRYRHALELRDDLEAWLQRRPTRALLQSLGPARRVVHRSRLFLGRHRWVAALLVLAGLGGAWAGLGLLGGEDVDHRAESAVWLAKARTALSEGDTARARTAAREALARDPRAEAPFAFLESLDRRDALRRELERARELATEARLALAEGREADGLARWAALERLTQHVMPLLEVEEDAELREATERLLLAARADRPLRIEVPGGSADLFLVPVARAGGRIHWSHSVSVEAEGGRIGPGAWIVRVRKGEGELFLPLTVAHGEDEVRVACPIDPGDVPADAFYVGGGYARGPLGAGPVAPLFWDRSEASCDRYGAFLDALSPEERRRRVPRA